MESTVQVKHKAYRAIKRRANMYIWNIPVEIEHKSIEDQPNPQEITKENNNELHLEDRQESEGYIEDIKKECANSDLDSLKSLIIQELSSSEQYTNQVSIVTRRFREMELYERREQVSILYPNLVDTLKVRKKYQHLSFGEKLHIYKEVKVRNNNKNEIAMKYKLSDTTIENIMREFSLHFHIPKLEDFKKSNRIMYSPEI